MTRKYIIRSGEGFYHVTARYKDRRFFPVSLDLLWMWSTQQLEDLYREQGLQIHAFVLMGNHFHLLCRTPKANIDVCMHELLRILSLRIRRETGRLGVTWEGRYQWSYIADKTHYQHVYRYVLQNPLRAKVVSRIEDYPFSTINQQMPFPMFNSMAFRFGGESGELSWLNSCSSLLIDQLIRKGLKKAHFDIEKRKRTLLKPLIIPPADIS